MSQNQPERNHDEDSYLQELLLKNRDLKDEYQTKFKEFMDKKSKTALGIVCFSVIIVILFILLSRSSLFAKFNEIIKFLITYVAVSVSFLLIVFSVYQCLPFLVVFKIRQCDCEIERCSRKLIQLHVSDNYTNSMMQLSYSYLDDYYLLTGKQANKSFAIMLLIIACGAILIGVGILLMFLGKTNPAFLSSASGIIIEMISTVFFYFYSKTVTNLGKYHNKLVLSQNISIALKVAEILNTSNDDSTMMKTVAKQLVDNINDCLTKSDTEIKENNKSD